MITQQNCIFLNPVYWNKEAQAFLPVEANALDLKTLTWNFTEMICYSTTTDDNAFLIEHSTTTQGNFLIEKKYTYGDITQILLTGAILLFFIFYLLKRLFFHEEVSIHSIHKKVF